MRYLIADFVTEYTPKYNNLKELSESFIYDGERETQIKLSVSDSFIEQTNKRMAVPDIPKTETFAYCNAFNRTVINRHTMLVHSSGIICGGKAYLFSADSGVGKSTHTRLWLKEFGEKVHIFNDDKPVIKINGKKVTAYGTPFDGGSGIALNESAPLEAIVFIERAEHNSIYVPSSKEIIKKLYFQTAHMVDAETAQAMLNNFDELLKSDVKFYVLRCNMESEAAHLAYNSIIEQ